MSTEVPVARRWAADPVTALAAVTLATAVASLGALAGWSVPPVALVLLGVTAAGLALSGST